MGRVALLACAALLGACTTPQQEPSVEDILTESSAAPTCVTVEMLPRCPRGMRVVEYIVSRECVWRTWCERRGI